VQSRSSASPGKTLVSYSQHKPHTRLSYPQNYTLSIAPARYKFLRQGLSITGAGSATFAEAIKSAQEVYAQFDRQFANGKLEKWSTAKYAGYHAIDLSNRYFTPKRDAPDMEHVLFTKLVDPCSILEDMAKSNYVHGEENVVQYYTCHVDEQRNRR
jgi:hypothetical protein